jgi:hypothetical protein
MTRSHVLLHCPNARVRAARVEACDDKEPGSIRVLLSNPRWEKRLLRFQELSGVGRVMEDGLTKKRSGQGGWTIGCLGKWRNGLCRGHQSDYLFSFSLSLVFA